MAHTKVYGFCDAKCKVEVVPKSGGEFTGNLTISRNVPSIYLKNTNVDSSATRTAYLNIAEQRFIDKNDVQIGRIRFDRDVTYTRYYLQLYENVGGETKNARFDFSMSTDGTSGLYLPSSPASNESTKKVATTEWVNDINNDVVHKSRNETISGVKTFSGITYLNASYGNTRINMKNLKQCATPPTSREVNYIATKGTDKDGKESTVWQLETIQGTDGLKIVQLATNFVNKDDGASNWSYPFRVIQQSNGSNVVKTLNPPSDANSDEIATANWVNNKFTVVDVERDFYEDYRTHTYVLQNVSDHAIITGVVSYNNIQIPFSGIFSYSKPAIYVLRDDIRVLKDSNTNCLDIWVYNEYDDMWERAQPSLCGLDAIAMNF